MLKMYEGERAELLEGKLELHMVREGERRLMVFVAFSFFLCWVSWLDLRNLMGLPVWWWWCVFVFVFPKAAKHTQSRTRAQPLPVLNALNTRMKLCLSLTGTNEMLSNVPP